MNNEQSVIEAEEKIEELKKAYVSYLNPFVLRLQNKGEEPTLEELLKCQQLGTEFFNFVESFVGSSGLLGAHTNGKWVTGFAETCYSVLSAFLVHDNFLRRYSKVFNGALRKPDINAYGNMQRMTKEYLPKDKWEQLESSFRDNSLPVAGFEYTGVSDLNKIPKWQLVTGLVVGLVFAVAILMLVVFIPNPTQAQFFVFRGLFAIALAATATIIPGLLNVESRFQKFSIKATGAIAIFVLVWLLNPPALIGS